MSFISKLSQGRIWERIFRERLSEPLHLNLISLFVLAFGTTRSKIYFDLLVRQHHAFGLLNAANNAKTQGIKSVSVIEFGVANGAGLVNICRLAEKISKETGVGFNVYGFDTGVGMPPPRDYRDHPERYMTGDFPMQDHAELKRMLPDFAQIVLGDVSETVPEFLQEIDSESPIGFVSIDVDYYWSAVESLKIFEGPANSYLPMVTVYLDDIAFEEHNPWCGELLAVNEFNDDHELRKISPFNHLRSRRLFKNADWIQHMFTCHIHDHHWRTVADKTSKTVAARVLLNPYTR